MPTFVQSRLTCWGRNSSGEGIGSRRDDLQVRLALVAAWDESVSMEHAAACCGASEASLRATASIGRVQPGSGAAVAWTDVPAHI